MKTIKGDLIQLAQEGHFDVIVHGCNCFCTMGAGIAKTIKTTFPEAYKADLETSSGDRGKLGTYSFAISKSENHEVVILNAYTQYDWRGIGTKVDYDAIRTIFRSIKETFSGLRIGYPAIGAGLAGGDWSLISEIIKKELDGEDHTFVLFEK